MIGRLAVYPFIFLLCAETGCNLQNPDEPSTVAQQTSNLTPSESTVADQPPRDSAVSEEPSMLSTKLIGSRMLSHGKKAYAFPWHYVEADHNEIRSGSVWRRITPIDGTKSTHLARYGDIEWHEYTEEAIETIGCQGIDFRIGSNTSGVGPGEGPVYILPWCYEETAKSGEMRFRSDRDFVICLDRVPVHTFTNIANGHGCHFQDELDHIIGVIEVEHTYNWRTLTDWNPFSLSDQTLVSFTQSRHRSDAEGYVLEYAVRRNEPETFDFQTATGTAPADDSIVEKLFYALRSYQWNELPKAHQFERVPPVTRATLVVDDGSGPIEMKIEYDNGGWFMTHRGKHFSMPYPQLLFRVQWEIEKAIENRVAGSP